MTEPLIKHFGKEFMDNLHEYPSLTGNVRYYHRLKARVVEEFLTRQAGPTKVFLDAGAGRGPYSFLGAPLFKEVYCDEYNKDELTKAQEFIASQNLIEKVHIKNNDLRQTDYTDNFFDAIVCSEVLEHIPSREKAVKELYRVLKPGGRILISMPQKNSLFYRRVRLKLRHLINGPVPAIGHPDWETYQHLIFSSQDIEKLITDAGFIIKNRFGANVLPLGEKIFSLLYKVPLLFSIYLQIEFLLEKLLPRFGSFYFVEAGK